MKTTQDISERTLADAWADLKAHADAGLPLQPDAYRLAFADPEFLLRRETRGLRIQLEMLKPELEMQAQGIENTIVVFGSARFLPPDEALLVQQAAMQTGDAKAVESAAQKMRNAQYYDQARLFSRLVAGYGARKPPKERLVICTGGGPGIMEAANRGAHEMGALNMGLSISLPHEQSGNRFVSPSLNFKFHYFAMRKMHFMMRAKALVAFPGGMGTLDELFEILTLVQTRKAKPVPIVLFGVDYWKRLVNFDVMVEEGTISKEDLALFTYTDDPQVAWSTIKTFYQLT
jgi:uncharacterized protein (TIGR00730 family)